jgi:predicted nucleic acid-binding protein
VAIPVVVLDANVLIPLSLRDTILRAAEKGLCRVHWTDEILEETRRNLVALGFTTQEQADNMIGAMRRFFEDVAVIDYQQYIPQMTDHPKDRHVTAAAWCIRASEIVTFNVRDFRPQDLAPFNLRAVSPDVFLMQLFAAAPDAMATIIREQEQDRIRPAKRVTALLDGLAKLAPRFAAAMRGHMDLP